MFKIKVSKNKESFGVEIYLDEKMVGFANSNWDNRFFESNLLTCETEQMNKEIRKWLRKEDLAVRALRKDTLVFNPHKLMKKDAENTMLYVYNLGITDDGISDAKQTYEHCCGEEIADGLQKELADDFFRVKTFAELNEIIEKNKKRKRVGNVNKHLLENELEELEKELEYEVSHKRISFIQERIKEIEEELRRETNEF